jgi:streptogrisin C
VRTKVRLLAIGGIVAAAVAVTAVAIPAQADVRKQVEPKLEPATVAGSVNYLRKTYGVTENEALRRLRLQATAHRLVKTLATQKSYAGLRLDQDNGGRLVISTTAPRDLAAVTAGLADKQHVSVRQVKHSLAELTGIQRRLGKDLAGSTLTTGVDVDANQVVVWKPDWIATAFAAPQQAAVDAAVARSGRAVVTRSYAKPDPLAAKDYGKCYVLSCDHYPPMRGGLRLDIPRDDNSIGGCTSGFNVRASGGTYAGKAFVLTAGHCVVGGRHTHQDTVFHQEKPVLKEEAQLEANDVPFGGNNDYALLSYVDKAAEQQWFASNMEHNLVLAWCQQGPLDNDHDTPCKDGDSNDDGRVHITNMLALNEVFTGEVVCATGSGANPKTIPGVVDSGAGEGYHPGTRCGRINDKTAGMVDTDLCARRGDSGGPLFDAITNSGIGILEGNAKNNEPNDDRLGACKNGEQNNYIPLSSILAQLNGTGGSTFDVIIRPEG